MKNSSYIKTNYSPNLYNYTQFNLHLIWYIQSEIKNMYCFGVDQDNLEIILNRDREFWIDLMLVLEY